MENVVELAEILAKRWMRGTRKGSERSSWAHPQDVVGELYKMPYWSTDKGFPYQGDVLLASAWLHDVLEDGTHHDDLPIEPVDILNVAWEEHQVQGPAWCRVVEIVEELTCPSDDPAVKKQYLEDFLDASDEAIVIKALDRVVNLREGRETFSEGWHGRYARKTWDSFVPALATIAPPWGPWLMQQLLGAMK